MVDLIKRISSRFFQSRPFVVFCLPDSTLVQSFLVDDLQIRKVESFEERGFVFAPFDGEPVYFSIEGSERISANITINERNKNIFHLADDGKQAFVDLVEKAVKAIANGEFEKVVLSRQELVDCGQTDFSVLISDLLASDVSTFRYCIYHPVIGIWMGATPEKLLEVKQNVLTTMALAGTQAYNETTQVEWHRKEVDEQSFVVDFISNSLSELGLFPEVSERFTVRAGDVVHLRTDIRCKIDGASNIVDAVRALHPTPAVCGLPKEPTRKFILDNEPLPREFYSGFLGLMNIVPDELNLFVNLRCMKIEGNTARLFMGCGITRDSIPESEFVETANKSLAMKRILFKQKQK